ncbi:MAG: matrixin family metalloprotease [Myxococcales bacterium]|nr:matrixin family metalloprotease [Myxococcales bacterium]
MYASFFVFSVYLVSFLGAFAPEAIAYQPFRTDAGKPVHWESLVIPIEIAGNPADIAKEFAVQTIETAMLTWQSLPCHPIVLHHVGEPKNNSYAIDGHNRILWMNGLWPGSPTELAWTVVTHDEATGQIVDADILMNDAGFLFGTASFGDPITYDLSGTITHELGHFLGLDHSQKSEATMTSDIDILTVTSLTSLHADDIVGVCSLYEPRPMGSERQHGNLLRRAGQRNLEEQNPDQPSDHHRMLARIPVGFPNRAKIANGGSDSTFSTGMITAVMLDSQSGGRSSVPLFVWIGMSAAVVLIRSRFFFFLMASLALTYFVACESDDLSPSDKWDAADQTQYTSDAGADAQEQHDITGGEVDNIGDQPAPSAVDLGKILAQQPCWTITTVTTTGFHAAFQQVAVTWSDATAEGAPKLLFEPDGRLRQQWYPNQLEPDKNCSVEAQYRTNGDSITWTMTTPSLYCPGEQNQRKETWTAALTEHGELALTLASSHWELGITGRSQQPTTWILTKCNDFSPRACQSIPPPPSCELSCSTASSTNETQKNFFFSCGPPPDAAVCTPWARNPNTPQITEQKCSIGCYDVVCWLDETDPNDVFGGCREITTGKSCSYDVQ